MPLVWNAAARAWYAPLGARKPCCVRSPHLCWTEFPYTPRHCSVGFVASDVFRVWYTGGMVKAIIHVCVVLRFLADKTSVLARG